MNHQPTTLTVAVAALLLSGTAFAATDDMGMQYTSATEGLSGSFRVNLYDSNDDETTGDDTVKGAALESLRLNFEGTADLGNGMSSSYGLELRSTPQGSGETGDDGKVDLGGTYVEKYHIGLNGRFGSLEFGRIAAAGFMIPSGSLDSLKGNSRKSPVSDPGDGTFKLTSPSINGWQFGFSAQLNDDGTAGDEMLDEVSFAAVYDTPLGLKVGAAYDKEAMGTTPDSEDDITGWRFGADYEQDNWKVAYEFRTYENFDGGIRQPRTVFLDVVIPAATGSGSNLIPGSVVIFNYNAGRPSIFTNEENREVTQRVAFKNSGICWNSCSPRNFTRYGHGAIVNDYKVHAFGVQFNLDKVTASANYSIEEVSYNPTFLAPDRPFQFVDLGRTALGVDIRYALGSKSSLLFGFSSVTTERSTRDWSMLDSDPDDGNDTTTLRYQVDF